MVTAFEETLSSGRSEELILHIASWTGGLQRVMILPDVGRGCKWQTEPAPELPTKALQSLFPGLDGDC